MYKLSHTALKSACVPPKSLKTFQWQQHYVHSLAATAMHECREKIGELLSQVCSGVGTEEVAAALQGLLAAAAHVRAAAIVALLDVPVFAEGTITDNKVKLPQNSLAHYEYSIQPGDSLLATATDVNVYKTTPCHSCCI